MWNPFKRAAKIVAGADAPADAPAGFPRPEWPPIQNLDSIDAVMKRADNGGVDLLLVASQPIDDAPETLDALAKKLEGYLATIQEPEFLKEMGHPPANLIRILLTTQFPIHPEALIIIANATRVAEQLGSTLEVHSEKLGEMLK